jgi:hypothetical protein
MSALLKEPGKRFFGTKEFIGSEVKDVYTADENGFMRWA